MSLINTNIIIYTTYLQHMIRWRYQDRNHLHF